MDCGSPKDGLYVSDFLCNRITLLVIRGVTKFLKLKNNKLNERRKKKKLVSQPIPKHHSSSSSSTLNKVYFANICDKYLHENPKISNYQKQKTNYFFWFQKVSFFSAFTCFLIVS